MDGSHSVGAACSTSESPLQRANHAPHNVAAVDPAPFVFAILPAPVEVKVKVMLLMLLMLLLLFIMARINCHVPACLFTMASDEATSAQAKFVHHFSIVPQCLTTRPPL